jgi:uroporphyrinogen III methyltransferase/synthase
MKAELSSSGKAYLVGAGPGDPGLLTIRGKECLEHADVVLYDNLANPCLLDHAPPHSERIYVGRCGRGAYVPQENVNQLILQKVREGKQVVRLKGGDPFVFGRGGEEAEVVSEAGLSVEIIPGVTSAVAVPAYAGIPVTHRTLASTVTFVTGHEDPTKGGTALEWPRLASSKGTLVFLMGMKNLPIIVEQLVKEGKSVDTPAAIIRWGTYSRQQTITGTLGTIVEEAQSHHMDPPTVIVIGEVVNLRDRLNWFESRALFGKRILVTRAQGQAKELSHLLRTFGGEPIECPTIEIVPPENWSELDRVFTELSAYEWIVFTSVNGVRWFMKRFREQGYDSRALHGMSICCIGPRTAEEIETYGVNSDLIPSTFQAEGLLEAMKPLVKAGHRVLIPRAAEAREILPDQLREMGAVVHVVPVYKTIRPEIDFEKIKSQIRNGDIDIITFASSSTVRNFCDMFESPEEVTLMTENILLACIGPITAKTVEELGLSVGLVAKENTLPSLVNSLAEYIRDRN